MSKVIIEKSGPVKTVWMNRPEKKNALDSELLGNMIEALQAPVAADDRVVVIRNGVDLERFPFCATGTSRSSASGPASTPSAPMVRATLTIAIAAAAFKLKKPWIW